MSHSSEPTSAAWLDADGEHALSDLEVTALGLRIWQNESNGRYAGLTAWNDGEQFASLGIGHFIWYPAALDGPFEESFPALLHYLRARNVLMLAWLSNIDVDCPWRSQEEFTEHFDSPKMTELREFLAGTIGSQSAFMLDRFKRSLPIILHEVPAQCQRLIEARFLGLATSSHGSYALLDYVNFKGEGIKG